MINHFRIGPLLWLVALANCLVWAAVFLRVENSLSVFLPAAQDRPEDALLDELRQGRAAQVILVGITGADAPTLAATSRALADALRPEPAFAFVSNGSEGLAPAALELLFQHRYLLSPTVSVERFSAASLHEQLRQRLEALSSPASLERRYLPADPTAELTSLLQYWRPEHGPAQRHGVWFSPDGERALLLLRTRAEGFDLELQRQALDIVRDRFRTVAAPDQALLLSGPGVFAVDSKATIERETRWVGTLGTLLAVSLLLLAYRSGRLLLLAALPLGGAVLIAATAVDLLFGGIHGITLAFGVTLIGVAMDYPVHLFSHLDGSAPPRRRLEKIWPTLRLSVLTSVVGFAALAWTDFPGLTQLGVFAAIGLLSAAAITRWLLPGLLPAHFGRPLDRGQRTLAAALLRTPRIAPWTAIALVLAALGYATSQRERLWENDLTALSPIAESQRQLDRELREQLGAADVRDLLLIRAPDLETLLQRAEAAEPMLLSLQRDGVLSGFDLPSRYLPSQARQRARQAALPPPERLATALEQALIGLPFRAEAFAPFLSAVEAARGQRPLTLDALTGTPLELRLLPLLARGDDGWHAFVPLNGVTARERIAAAVSAAALTGLEYVDMRQGSSDMVSGFRDAALERSLWGAAAALLCLWLGLHSLRAAVAAALPVAAAVAVDLALLLALGERLSLFHLISLLLVVGMGIDYSLFFRRLDDGDDAHQTAHALLLCAASTVGVFALLGLSQLPVLRAIGLTVALGIGGCFAFAWALRRPAAGASVDTPAYNQRQLGVSNTNPGSFVSHSPLHARGDAFLASEGSGRHGQPADRDQEPARAPVLE